MMEHLVAAAQRFGFAPSDAKKLVVQTFIGASALAAQSDDDLATLRAKVTSKGGTTAAALATFEAMGLGQVLAQGAVAAKERARGLSEELSQSTSVSTSASSLPSSPKN
jgi:pyrroline-5-carboxylate reductase